MRPTRALFPGLLWLHVKIVRQRRIVSALDSVLILGLAMFMLVFPLGSLIGLIALVVFADEHGVYSTARGSMALYRRAD